MKAVRATIEVGNEIRSTPLERGATHAVLELKLKKGLFDLETTFQHPAEHVGYKEWGAYYVYVDYLGH